MGASAMRSLCKAIHRWNTHIHSVRLPNACIYLYPCAAGYTDERSTMRARRTHAPHVLHPCARAFACVKLGRPRICADTCERLAPASTAGGSARRRLSWRRLSTRTSARGTPPRSPRCIGYAPPLRPGRRATAGGTRSVHRRCSVGRCARRDRRCARAGVRRFVGARMRGHPWVKV